MKAVLKCTILGVPLLVLLAVASADAGNAPTSLEIKRHRFAKHKESFSERLVFDFSVLSYGDDPTRVAGDAAQEVHAEIERGVCRAGRMDHRGAMA